MSVGVSMLHSSGFITRRLEVSVIFALSLILFFLGVSEAQQSAPNRKNAPQASKTQTHFPEVKELLRQGLTEKAKEKIQEELQQNPSSVEGYNLLGIIYIGQKDYAKAL